MIDQLLFSFRASELHWNVSTTLHYIFFTLRHNYCNMGNSAHGCMNVRLCYDQICWIQMGILALATYTVFTNTNNANTQIHLHTLSQSFFFKNISLLVTMSAVCNLYLPIKVIYFMKKLRVMIISYGWILIWMWMWIWIWIWICDSTLHSKTSK